MNTKVFFAVVPDRGPMFAFSKRTVERHNLKDRFYLDAIVTPDYFNDEWFDQCWIHRTPTMQVRTLDELPSTAVIGETYLIEELNTMLIYFSTEENDRLFIEYTRDWTEWSDRFWDESLCVDELTESDRTRRMKCETGVMNHDRQFADDWHEQTSHSIH